MSLSKGFLYQFLYPVKKYAMNMKTLAFILI